jgi:hypothetical protein
VQKTNHGGEKHLDEEAPHDGAIRRERRADVEAACGGSGTSEDRLSDKDGIGGADKEGLGGSYDAPGKSP